jgi:uncharacterized protein (TIGR01244 family)
MARVPVMRFTVATAMVALIPNVGAAQRLTGPKPTAQVPAPVALDTLGMFQARFVKVGDDVFIGGQPTERALRELRAQGVTTVVNLRTPPEMQTRVPFDEAALVKELGMQYVYLPMRGTPDFPYSPDAVKAFTAAMTDAKGKVLLHCTIAWRASHLWTAYMIQSRDVPAETAVKFGRMINLMDEMRMDPAGQPVEAFLGRTLPEVAHPKPPMF